MGKGAFYVGFRCFSHRGRLTMTYRNSTNYFHPLIVKVSITVPASGNETLIEWVPDNEIYFIKQINVTADGLTVHSVNMDGTNLEEVGNVDVVGKFGTMLTAWETIAVDLENTGTTEVDATLEIIGYSSFRD
jgi:hypothetical protein